MKPSGYRYRILALLFVATTINYMDRSIIGVLAPTLQYQVFHWSDVDYATISMAFKLAYAVGMLAMGAIVDRLGTRIGYTVSIAIWSVFGMLHALVRPAFSLIGFSLARFGLGFGEAGNFPAAIKTVAEWFPRKDRAFATGIFNAGSNVGAILAPLCIPLIVSANGEHWQRAFLITGIFSFIWVLLWWRWGRPPEGHPGVNAAELDYIRSDTVPETAEKIPWRRVLPLPQTWAFAVGKLTDAAWWFYLFWTGKYLFDQFGLDVKKLALPLIIIYLLADVGSVAGGWFSGFLIKKGWTINKARKFTMLACALLILPVMWVTQVGTSFHADARFFEKLRQREVPAPVIQQLAALDGMHMPSAKEFVREVRSRVQLPQLDELMPVLINSARSDNRYWMAVLLIALAAAGHQAWSANLFTLVSDVFPAKAVASVTGIGGMVGAMAGLAADFSLGQVLQSSGPSGYFFAFLGAGMLYLIALLFIHLLMPRMTPWAG